MTDRDYSICSGKREREFLVSLDFGLANFFCGFAIPPTKLVASVFLQIR